MGAMDMIDQTLKSLDIIVWVVVIAVGLLAIIFFALKIRNELAKGGGGGAQESAPISIDNAQKSERRGDFIKAAMNYEQLGDKARAAAMYEKGRQFAKAASIYEQLGNSDKAVAMYKRAGESLKAAGVYMRTRNYAEAAKIFKNKGDTLRAAQAFEMMGNKLAAAREYAEAGQYVKSARMYKDERMYVEAGEVYSMALGGGQVTPSNIGMFYTYAAFLVMSDELARAQKVYRSIADVDASFKDVQEKLRLLGLRTGQTVTPELAIDKAARDEMEHEELMAAAPAPEPPAPEPPRAPERPKEPVSPKAAKPSRAPEPPKAPAPQPQPPEKHAPEPTAKPVAKAPVEPVEEKQPVDDARYAAAIEDLSVPDTSGAAPAAPEQAIHDTAAPEPVASPVSESRTSEPRAEDTEKPMDEPMDETVPSARVDSAPSRDASAAEIAQKVIQQNEIDDLFDEEGAGDMEEEVSGDDDSKREVTLRSILKPGRMDPRYSMRMWMQILKKLYEKHSAGVYYGSIPPESIRIDMENNVRLDDPGRQQAEYTAPEVITGSPPDEQTDIYAMGVILYEMVTGTMETIGEMDPIDAYDDVPEWMDEMIMRCIEKDRSVRYRGLDDISSLVLQRATTS